VTRDRIELLEQAAARLRHADDAYRVAEASHETHTWRALRKAIDDARVGLDSVAAMIDESTEGTGG
jgi:hypothetical protein